jgi:hypothetical protein
MQGVDIKNLLKNIMKKLLKYGATVAALGTMLAFAASVGATAPSGPKVPAAPGQNKIQCFEDGTGDCTLTSNGAKGSATLTVTGATGTGDAGVYYLGYNNSIYSVPLANVTQLSFNYTGTATGGAPRFSIPIDQDNNSSTGNPSLGAGTEGFAFVGAALCNDGAGFVDVVNDPTCDVNYLGVDYPNWAAFTAAFPSAVVSFGDYVFVIADETGTWTVSNVVIGKPGK